MNRQSGFKAKSKRERQWYQYIKRNGGVVINFMKSWKEAGGEMVGVEDVINISSKTIYKYKYQKERGG